MTTRITRRTALATPESEIMRLFREWRAHAAIRPHYDEPDAILEAHEERRTEIEKSIMAAPTQDARDMAIKVYVYTLNGELPLDGDWSPLEEIQRLVGPPTTRWEAALNDDTRMADRI